MVAFYIFDKEMSHFVKMVIHTKFTICGLLFYLKSLPLYSLKCQIYMKCPVHKMS